ncbi:GAF and ANTAR domain-containing protein [Streptomyces violascens]|uniref:GAF domain-containing protein n=1 Tax=Streptomyces violascens TaxID=67381 RepID=A0ABQ3QXJ8_9ACTN|nr:GAF and ANTAR domain-containing protein [Streptomyces violascens]GGU13866.1 GAF domain-containing protein [Streptomyces violascens]GHI42008.1 GAF domain-containing protein [Streptomyces violascens]
MTREERDAASGAAPPPKDGLSELLARAHLAARNGHGPDTAVPPGAARLLGLDALTLNMLAADGHLELLWCDPAEGLGPELDNLQYTLGDGPALEAVKQGRTLSEPDLPAADPARWPLFLPAAARTPVRALIAAPLRLGAATIGVLTGYRTAPGPLTPAQRRGLDRVGRTLVHLLYTELITSADDGGAVTGLRLYRAEVHQATGFLASELGIPMGQALLRLRAHAATYGHPLSDLARDLLARRLAPDTLDRAE